MLQGCYFFKCIPSHRESNGRPAKRRKSTKSVHEPFSDDAALFVPLLDGLESVDFVKSRREAFASQWTGLKEVMEVRGRSKIYRIESTDNEQDLLQRSNESTVHEVAGFIHSINSNVSVTSHSPDWTTPNNPKGP